MGKMKKMLAALVALVCVLTVLAGCTTSSSMSYTYSVDNGDSVKVTLDTSDKYRISSKLPFTITCDGETLTQGTFIQGEAYSEYINAVERDEKAYVLDSGTKDGNEYEFWVYDNSEYNYVIRIGGSNTGVLLGNIVSQESAQECFNRLTITAVK